MKFIITLSLDEQIKKQLGYWLMRADFLRRHESIPHCTLTDSYQNPVWVLGFYWTLIHCWVWGILHPVGVYRVRPSVSDDTICLAGKKRFINKLRKNTGSSR